MFGRTGGREQHRSGQRSGGQEMNGHPDRAEPAGSGSGRVGGLVLCLCLGALIGCAPEASAQDGVRATFEQTVAGPAFARAMRDDRCSQTLWSRVPQQFVPGNMPPAWIVLGEDARPGEERRSVVFIEEDGSGQIALEQEVNFARVTVLFRAAFVATAMDRKFLLRDLLPPGRDEFPVKIEAGQSYLIFAGEGDVAIIGVACPVDNLRDVMELAYGITD